MDACDPGIDLKNLKLVIKQTQGRFQIVKESNM